MNSIIEAKRYLDNARQILKEKANKEDGYYQDKKYVKLAGHAAYSGVLVALDGFLGDKKKGRKSVEWYQKELAGLDKKVSSTFSNVYEILYLSLGYDGATNAELAQLGLREAEKVIDWIQTRLYKN